jgi:hypothetical protein
MPAIADQCSDRAALDHAFALRAALDEHAMLGDGFWVGLGMPPGGVSKLHTALAELGPSLRPRTKKKRGPKGSLESWNDYANLYASVIATALRQAGVSNPSEERAKGPVARIGAKAIKRVFQIERSPASFASAVRAVRLARVTSKGTSLVWPPSDSATALMDIMSRFGL